jgi:hypothetical protein
MPGACPGYGIEYSNTEPTPNLFFHLRERWIQSAQSIVRTSQAGLKHETCNRTGASGRHAERSSCQHDQSSRFCVLDTCLNRHLRDFWVRWSVSAKSLSYIDSGYLINQVRL